MTSITFSLVRVDKAARLSQFPSPEEIKSDPNKVQNAVLKI